MTSATASSRASGVRAFVEVEVLLLCRGVLSCLSWVCSVAWVDGGSGSVDVVLHVSSPLHRRPSELFQESVEASSSAATGLRV